MDPLFPEIPLTPRTLPQILWALLTNAWSQKDILFTQAFPEGELTKPTIAWAIERRVPQRGDLTEHKPRFRSRIESGTMEEGQIWAKWFTVRYRFDIYHASAPDADRLAEEFEREIFGLVPALQKLGVDEFLFDEEVSDNRFRERKDLHVRTLYYRAILEQRFQLSLPRLSRIFLRTLFSIGTKYDQEVVRGPLGADDLMPHRWLSQLLSVSSIRLHSAQASGDFIPDIDFVVVPQENGQWSIRWIPGRYQPAEGATYYVTYNHYTQSELQHFGEDPYLVSEQIES